MQEFRSFKEERSFKREGEFCHWMGCCYQLPTVFHQRSFRERPSGFICWGEKQQKISQTNSVNITFPQKVDFYAIFNRVLVMTSEREKKESCSAFSFEFRGIACLCDYSSDLIQRRVKSGKYGSSSPLSSLLVQLMFCHTLTAANMRA